MRLLLLVASLAAAPLHLSGSGPAVASHAERVWWNNGLAYTYDGAGNIIGIGNQTYYYDAAGRLVYSTDPDGAATTYTYDAFGNRKSCTAPGGGSCQAGLTVNSSNNRLSAPVAYDASGRVTAFQGHTYTYDAADMPRRDSFGTTATEYIYTADDERIAVVAPAGQWQWTVRGLSGKVIREFTSTGATNFSWSKDYIWRGDLLMATRQREPNGAVTTYHYHLDHLGTPRRITDAADRIVGTSDYQPFGSRLSGGTNPPSPNRIQFTGHERDTGSMGEQTDTLDYMHARYYSPYAGRFLSVDPERGSVDLHAPQSWNRYSYALNNPVLHVDPDGRATAIPWGGLVRVGSREVIKQVGTRAAAGSAAGPIGVAVASAGITGWQIGRGIGTSTIGGRSIDSYVQGALLAAMSDGPPKSLDEVLIGTVDKVNKSTGTTILTTTGTYGDALQDFNDVVVADTISDKGKGVLVGTTPDGETVVVRPHSSDGPDGSAPTLEVQDGKTKTKQRYREREDEPGE